MAEYTANAVQEVAANSNVLFTNVAVKGGSAIYHRDGSGLISLRGLTCSQPRARFRVAFNGNIAVPADGTVESISCAIALDGEYIAESTMIATPAAADEYFNVSSGVFIDAPSNCCAQLSIQNISTQAINIQNANLIIERIA